MVKTLSYFHLFFFLFSLCALAEIKFKGKIDKTHQHESKNTQFNCGPIVLKELLKGRNISSQLDDLIKSSQTEKGKTSMLGMIKALEGLGLKAKGYKTDLPELKRQTGVYDQILLFSQNNHYVLVKGIQEDAISLYDPAWVTENRIHRLNINSFKKEWDGHVIFVEK